MCFFGRESIVLRCVCFCVISMLGRCFLMCASAILWQAFTSAQPCEESALPELGLIARVLIGSSFVFSLLNFVLPPKRVLTQLR